MPLVPPALALPPAPVPAGDKPFKTAEALEAWIAGYAGHPEPARLRSALREAMAFGILPGRPDLLAFFATAARRSPEVHAALEGGLVQEDLAGVMAVLLVFRCLGEDVTDRLIFLPDDFRGRFAAFPPLPDPRTPLPWGPTPTAAEVQRALDQVEAALGAWRATGDPVYLGVLTAGLAHAADHPAFQAWSTTEPRDPNPAPAVARGCYYDRACSALRRLRADAKARAEFRGWIDDPTRPEWLREGLRRVERQP
jgi:hypothetical protein